MSWPFPGISRIDGKNQGRTSPCSKKAGWQLDLMFDSTDFVTVDDVEELMPGRHLLEVFEKVLFV